ncbi:MAG: hypothetical protein ABH883_09640 [Candidatus Omnitrophota bacterium]
MPIKILGIIWIIASVILFLKPVEWKEWLQKNRENKVLLVIPFLLGTILAIAGFTRQGIIAVIILIVGFMAIIKAVVAALQQH